MDVVESSFPTTEQMHRKSPPGCRSEEDIDIWYTEGMFDFPEFRQSVASTSYIQNTLEDQGYLSHLPVRMLDQWYLFRKPDPKVGYFEQYRCQYPFRRAPLPVNGSLDMDGYVLVGILVAPQDENIKVKVELAELDFFTIDLKSEFQGYHVVTEVARYWLKNPCTKMLNIPKLKLGGALLGEEVNETSISLGAQLPSQQHLHRFHRAQLSLLCRMSGLLLWNKRPNPLFHDLTLAQFEGVIKQPWQLEEGGSDEGLFEAATFLRPHLLCIHSRVKYSSWFREINFMIQSDQAVGRHLQSIYQEQRWEKFVICAEAQDSKLQEETLSSSTIPQQQQQNNDIATPKTLQVTTEVSGTEAPLEPLEDNPLLNPIVLPADGQNVAPGKESSGDTMAMELSVKPDTIDSDYERKRRHDCISSNATNAETLPSIPRKKPKHLTVLTADAQNVVPEQSSGDTRPMGLSAKPDRIDIDYERKRSHDHISSNTTNAETLPPKQHFAKKTTLLNEMGLNAGARIKSQSCDNPEDSFVVHPTCSYRMSAGCAFEPEVKREITRRIKARIEARRSSNFQEGDAIREYLARQYNIQIHDFAELWGVKGCFTQHERKYIAERRKLHQERKNSGRWARSMPTQASIALKGQQPPHHASLLPSGDLVHDSAYDPRRRNHHFRNPFRRPSY